MTAQPEPTSEPIRRPRRRRPYRRPDPAHITPTPAPEPTPSLFIKYDTPPPLDAAEMDDVIDQWRRHGWTD